MNASNPEVSVVIPCLNEEESLPFCLERIRETINNNNLLLEVIVADNGSSDRSREIAREFGARVVDVPERGYGSALMGGIEAAQAEFIVMGDADGSYDFAEIPNFLAKHREGYDLVQGCRLPAGGGKIMPQAMPFMHRWLGNPMLTFLSRLMFGSPSHDVYCGLRGFTREHYQRLNQRCTGMEFAVEMIIKSSLLRARIGEIPITLHRDQRQTQTPHLRTYRDGWRTLRFFLLSSPNWLYLIPGIIMILAGVLGYLLALPGVTIFGATLGVHTLLLASVAMLCGYQAILFGIFAKTFAEHENLIPKDPNLNRFYSYVNLEKGIILSLVLGTFGLSMILGAFIMWKKVDFQALDYAKSMRLLIPGGTLVLFAFQTILSSFFVSIMSLSRK